jgi:hypothetical protein
MGAAGTFIDEQANKLMTVLHNLINGYEVEAVSVNFVVLYMTYFFVKISGKNFL